MCVCISNKLHYYIGFEENQFYLRYQILLLPNQNDILKKFYSCFSLRDLCWLFGKLLHIERYFVFLFFDKRKEGENVLISLDMTKCYQNAFNQNTLCNALYETLFFQFKEITQILKKWCDSRWRENFAGKNVNLNYNINAMTKRLRILNRKRAIVIDLSFDKTEKKSLFFSLCLLWQWMDLCWCYISLCIWL